MSRRHVCPGDGCPVCEDAIDAREFPEPDDDRWMDAQDQYERDLDRRGGSL